MDDRQNHIEALELMLAEKDPPEPFRAALVAARDRLAADERRERAKMQNAYRWPYCSKCGKPYRAKPTNDYYVHRVEPSCNCHASMVWDGRPELTYRGRRG